MRGRLALACLALLAGCAAPAPLPSDAPALTLPRQLHVQREQAGTQRDFFLVIQADGAALHFSLLDPLGVPLARQHLQAGQWHADGLLPPNAEARVLFAATLFALTPDAELTRHYPAAGQRGAQRWLPGHWRSSLDRRLLLLDMGKGLTYRVAPLADGAALP